MDLIAISSPFQRIKALIERNDLRYLLRMEKGKRKGVIYD